MNSKALSTICLSFLCAGAMAVGCACSGKSGNNKAAEQNEKLLEMKIPYSADSAYKFIEDQVAFGPRVPGTEANRKCADYIVQKLRQFGADSIITQDFDAQVYTGDNLPMRNIMGRFTGNTSNDRILLIAHYDTRPWADRDKHLERRTEPILGANDGASGVATLLALAYQFAQHRPDIGVDLLFVDGEDYGQAAEWDNNDNSWCLGSQYWVNHKPDDYTVRPPRFGILLDMVGGRNARFPREFLSEKYASSIVDKVWGIAAATGHGSIFMNMSGGSVIDDHYFINQAGIPTVDVIDINNAETGSFPESWHTHDDNMESISRATLRYVGRAISNVIYYEKP